MLYASYSLGQAKYAGLFAGYQNALGSYDLNPYQLQVCGVAYEQATSDTIAKLKNCLGL